MQCPIFYFQNNAIIWCIGWQKNQGGITILGGLLTRPPFVILFIVKSHLHVIYEFIYKHISCTWWKRVSPPVTLFPPKEEVLGSVPTLLEQGELYVMHLSMVLTLVNKIGLNGTFWERSLWFSNVSRRFIVLHNFKKLYFPFWWFDWNYDIGKFIR